MTLSLVRMTPNATTSTATPGSTVGAGEAGLITAMPPLTHLSTSAITFHAKTILSAGTTTATTTSIFAIQTRIQNFVL